MPTRWVDEYTKDALRDLERLGEPRRTRAKKAIAKVLRNPLPMSEGGYGKPLGNKRGANLTGLYKIKLRGDGIRVVYALERRAHLMIVIVISVRGDDEVYRQASRRIE